ncbi:AAA family ATPase [Culicoidibacter larvae]|uniref:AAA+ ATPase domain-containing protein n=1 Tax=Culicoidibacter larvae TaxID=2579976 RepID=A0A5R8QFL7_9FIRM|nr:AAA family ATPase [Culicoidibacter larvae]TLG76550.1 hypothetical protein FEZ08_02735 [Culicoidibacter larvae]
MIYVKGVSIRGDNSIDFKKFPFNLPVVKNLNNIVFDKAVTIFIGENGVGKSTLIEAIAISLGFNPEGGNKNVMFSTYDSHSELYKDIVLSKLFIPKDGFFLRSETLYTLETKLHEYFEDDENYSMHQCSHGEGVLKLLQRYFVKDGIYILDEPEAALSPASQFVFLNLMHELAEMQNCQFIIATHSPLIAGYEYARVYEMSIDNGVEAIKFEDSVLAMLYKRYLESQEYRRNVIGLD